MAAKSATSSTKSDQTLKTFVTLRVTGDELVPDEVTQLLKIQPTHARIRGKPYSTGRSKNILPTTNIWFFSTDGAMVSRDILDHICFALFVLGLMGSSDIIAWNAADHDNNAPFARLLTLKSFLAKSSAKATMTFFWHGASRSTSPTIPKDLFDIMRLIEVDMEIDFNKDENLTTTKRGPKAA